MNEKLVAAINKQIAFEMESAYAYLAMSLQMSANKLPGYGAWLRKQYEEELMHAFKLVDYLDSRDEKVVLENIVATPVNTVCPLEIAKEVLAHEQKVTAKINELYALAIEEKDFATREFLGWFVTEQVEEEQSAREIIDLFEFAGENKSALLFLDAKLGGR